MNPKTLNQKKLTELLTYAPLTGEFRWVNNRGRIRAGTIAGGLTSYGYWRISIDNHKYQAHKLAWLYTFGKWPTQDIDHKNRIRFDNRLSNLREASKVENSHNTRALGRSTTGFRGVSKKRSKWIARIMIDGVPHRLGSFSTPEEASSAYELYRQGMVL